MKRFAITLTACLISICAAAQGVLSVESESAVLDNGNVEILITVNLEPQWYIYSTEPVKGGPMATSLTAADNGPYTLEGTLRDTETPHTKIDPGFQMEVKYFENSVRFAQTLRPSTTEKFTFKGWLEFQTCNGMECLLNEEEMHMISRKNEEDIYKKERRELLSFFRELFSLFAIDDKDDIDAFFNSFLLIVYSMNYADRMKKPLDAWRMLLRGLILQLVGE